MYVQKVNKKHTYLTQVLPKLKLATPTKLNHIISLSWQTEKCTSQLMIILVLPPNRKTKIHTAPVVKCWPFILLISSSCSLMLAKLLSHFGPLFVSPPGMWAVSSQGHGPEKQSWEQKVLPRLHTRSHLHASQGQHMQPCCSQMLPKELFWKVAYASSALFRRMKFA